jgi:hypothetical protein
MEAFWLLLFPILVVACCGLPLIIIGAVALFNRGKARLREMPSAPPLTQESEEIHTLNKNID